MDGEGGREGKFEKTTGISAHGVQTDGGGLRRRLADPGQKNTIGLDSSDKMR